jgi:hypothetical protein
MPVEILFFAAQGAGRDLAVDDEESDLLEALDRRGAGARFNLRTVLDSDFSHLRESLDDAPFAAVHLSAHGDRDGTMLAVGDYGDYRVHGAHLAPVFAGRGIQLVVLSVCHALDVARALAAHVPCVVAADTVLKSQTISLFNGGFYATLAHGGTVEQAFAAGCLDAGVVVGTTDHLHLIGDQADDIRLVDLKQPAPDPAARPIDVCVVATPAMAHISRRIQAQLEPFHTVYVGPDARPGDFVDRVGTDGLAQARLVMIVHEEDLDALGDDIRRSEQAWYVRDHVIGAISQKLADPQRRLFPVYLDGPPPSHLIYHGLRRVVGLDVPARKGLTRAMRWVRHAVLEASQR